MLQERRVNRSKMTSTALELLFSASASRAQFDSLVLAEEHGLLVAGAGDGAETEEIAALSAMVASECDLWHGKLETTAGAKKVTITVVDSPEGRMYLAGVGGQQARIVPELMHSYRGVRRIMA